MGRKDARTASGSIGRSAASPLTATAALRFAPCRFPRNPTRRPAGAFCSPWPWKVWRFAPARSVLRSPGRPCRPSPFPKAWRAKPAMPYRPPGRTCALRARTARPSVVLCVLCDPLRPLWMKIHWQSFVYLRGPSCSSCQPRRAPLPHPSQRPHLCGKHAAPLKKTLQKGLYLIS